METHHQWKNKSAVMVQLALHVALASAGAIVIVFDAMSFELFEVPTIDQSTALGTVYLHAGGRLTTAQSYDSKQHISSTAGRHILKFGSERPKFWQIARPEKGMIVGAGMGLQWEV